MDTPRISIIIPMFNAEDFIETCLDSILRQTFQSFEVIIVDDCSTDGSFELVREKYCVESGEKFDPRIKLFRIAKDLHFPLSFGMSLTSESEYIYWMDDDDAMLPNCLETFYNAIEKSGADSVHMNAHYDSKEPDFKFAGQSVVKKRTDLNSEPRFLDENLFQRAMKESAGQLSHVYWTKILRRKLFFDGTLPIPTKPVFPGDSYWFMQEICLVKKIQVIDACQYVHRIHPASIMQQPPEKKIRQFLNALPTGIELVEEIFESDHLISKVTAREKLVIELNFFSVMFSLFIFNQSVKLGTEKFHEILLDAFSKTAFRDPKIPTLLFDLMNAYAANSKKFRG